MRNKDEVMSDISNAFFSLSPENLSCDGELSRGETLRRERQIKAQLKGFFDELGKEISEDEALNWYLERRSTELKKRINDKP